MNQPSLSSETKQPHPWLLKHYEEKRQRTVKLVRDVVDQLVKEERAVTIVVDQTTPVRWTLVVEGPSEQWRDLEWTMDGTRKTYSTSDLKALAKKLGFGEWQRSQVGEVGALAWTSDGQEKFLMPLYQVPDRTSYPKD